MSNDWAFVHDLAEDTSWKPGLREIFDYRDLGIKDATNGDYVAHIIRANGKKMKDEVHHWHVHDCNFQFVLVLNGWAIFEYEGQGVHTIRTGDCIHQTPMLKHREIECSEDFEVLEIVSPANFETRIGIRRQMRSTRPNETTRDRERFRFNSSRERGTS